MSAKLLGMKLSTTARWDLWSCEIVSEVTVKSWFEVHDVMFLIFCFLATDVCFRGCGCGLYSGVLVDAREYVKCEMPVASMVW